ncbi:helix-turn-helix transcriptional regulator [Caldimonas tepidiphila]|uniref:helix-turn-helix transcriptional regulator n=1 Tax=Caldimonas tepidiphila TaxID=2315841 RepID=UPI000E5BD286|nr:WYL domain-containing protein [Caldimonas tepidiphila]
MDRNFQRLLDTLVALPRNGWISTPQLHQRLAAKGHEVTARTVQRDLENLATVYPIECDQRSRPFGWRWGKNAQRLSLPDMDWPEAVSFQMLATYLEGVLPSSVLETLQPYVEEARRKLAQHFQNLPLRRWPERVRIIPPGPSLVAHRVPKAVHAATTEAVLLGQQLSILYRGFEKPDAKRYIVSPLGLVQSGSGFYLPVRFQGHQDVRTIKLHRVLRAELLETPAEMQDFDLSEWIDSGALGFGGNERIRLVARFYEGAGEWVQEAPLSEDQEVVREGAGTHRATATVLLTVQLKRWLLGLGWKVEVLAPSELREEMARSLRAAAARYESPEKRRISAAPQEA